MANGKLSIQGGSLYLDSKISVAVNQTPEWNEHTVICDAQGNAIATPDFTKLSQCMVITKTPETTDASETPAVPEKEQEKKGCKGAMDSTYAVIALISVLGFAFVAKKKEEN